MNDSKFPAINCSQLIEDIAAKQDQLRSEDVRLAVLSCFEYLSRKLSLGHRVEIRGFGSFSVHFRKPRTMLNPRTQEYIGIGGRNIPHFKASKWMNQRINKTNVTSVSVVTPTDQTRSDKD